MTTNEDQTTRQAGPVRQPKATTKPKTAPRKRRVAAGKAKSAKKASPISGRAESQKAAKRTKPAGAREGSKAAKVLDLLKRPKGATLKELMKATGWQAHSVRGFLSGAVGKKLGLTVASINDNGERTYSVKA